MVISQRVIGSGLNVRLRGRQILRVGQLLGLTAVMLFPGAAVFAQGSPHKSIEIFRGTNRSESSMTNPGIVPPPAPAPRIQMPSGGLTNPATATAKHPLPRQAIEMAQLLAQQSTETFERGLLPLEGYLEHLRFVTYVEQRAAAEQNQPQRVIAAAQQHVDRLAHAAELLEEFRQPAAEGWEAQTLLAQAATAEAQANLAQLRGQKEQANLATQQFQDLAIRHLEAREFDTAVLGIGSLPTMAAAIELVARSNRVPDADGVIRETRENVLLTTEHWHAAGAEIGRADQVQEAQIAAAKARGNWAVISGDMPQFAAAVAEAEVAARDLFDTRLEFYANGTASIADLTDALLVRNRLHQLASTQPELMTPEMDEVWKRDLHELVTLSDDIEDRRGRNTPDIQFVHLLNLVDRTDRTPLPQAPVSNPAAPPATRPAPAPPRPVVPSPRPAPNPVPDPNV